MRLFVAVDIPGELKKKIVETQGLLGGKNADINFAPPENLHFTVKFLGDVENTEEIKNILFSISNGFQKFDCSICNLGYFGSANHIRVLWVGMDKGKEEFVRIVKNVDKKLSYIRKEDYEQSPHLTIGRVGFVKNREKFLEQIKSLQKISIGSFVVKKLKLKQSVLGSKGPVYKDVETFTLK